MKADLKRYAKERDEMLKKCSVAEYRKFVRDHAYMYSTEFITAFNEATDKVLEVSLHKMIVNAVNLPIELRETSSQWLLSRGFDLSIV